MVPFPSAMKHMLPNRNTFDLECWVDNTIKSSPVSVLTRDANSNDHWTHPHEPKELTSAPSPAFSSFDLAFCETGHPSTAEWLLDGLQVWVSWRTSAVNATNVVFLSLFEELSRLLSERVRLACVDDLSVTTSRRSDTISRRNLTITRTGRRSIIGRNKHKIWNRYYNL